MRPVDCPLWKGEFPTEDAMMIEKSDMDTLTSEALIAECRFWDTITRKGGKEVFWIVLESEPSFVRPLSLDSLESFLKTLAKEQLSQAV